MISTWVPICIPSAMLLWFHLANAREVRPGGIVVPMHGFYHIVLSSSSGCAFWERRFDRRFPTGHVSPALSSPVRCGVGVSSGIFAPGDALLALVRGRRELEFFFAVAVPPSLLDGGDRGMSLAGSSRRDVDSVSCCRCRCNCVHACIIYACNELAMLSALNKLGCFASKLSSASYANGIPKINL